MTGIKFRNLADDLPYGARVTGVDRQALSDAAVRSELAMMFEQKGLILFEDMEPSSQLQVELAKVFGPVKAPLTSAPRQSGDDVEPLAVLDLHYQPSGDPAKLNDLVEIGGQLVARFSPWHFDHCYNDELNRGAVLRAPVSTPEGGRTGFLDGVELYRAFPKELRDRLEAARIIYLFDIRLTRMRFGANFKVLKEPLLANLLAEGSRFPRAMQPAIWTRKSGEKVLHVGPWTSVGIEEQEDPDGNALLEETCQEINRLGAASAGHAYWHRWKPTDMILWDNWRMLHAVEGIDPQAARRTLRVTIKGDYGLGSFEDGKKIGEVQHEFA